MVVQRGSGTVAADGSGNGNVGSLANGAAWTSAGKYGGDHVRWCGRLCECSGFEQFGCDVWCDFGGVGSSYDVECVASDHVEGTPWGFGLCLVCDGEAGNRPEGQVVVNSNWQFVQGSAALAVNTWSHVAMTYDGVAMRLYVNGSLVATKAQTGAVLTSGGALRIGGNSIWGEWFAGQIDEARVYNRALSAAEVVTDSTTGGLADTVPRRFRQA